MQTGLATQLRVIPIGDSHPNFPNFSRYDPSAKSWNFEWRQWLSALRRHPISRTIEDPRDYRTTADRRDLLIVRELQRNARATFAEMAPVLGISLQGVKYHFDKKLVPSGIVKYFGFDITPYPHDLSAAHQILLNFTNKPSLNRFFSSMNEMFFIQDVAKVLKSNSLLIRTYVPQNQVPSMFSLFSELAKQRVLQTYSAVRLSSPEEENQTVQPALFVDQKGWMFDARKYNSELSKRR
jgi:DNA-binding Lrp family transcriptional regulator